MAYANYIHRTPSSNGNRQKFTISTWVKRPEPKGQGWILTVDSYPSGNMFQYQLDTASYFGLQQYHGNAVQASINTSNLLKDPNAWYHLVLRVDTTQSTAADRVRLYINGTEATYNSPNYPSQNFEFQVNHVTKQSINSREDTSAGESLYFSHYYLCDGYSYAPTEFGETDSTTGEWKIKTSPSVSYGTNGFFVLKDGNSVTDQSGQGNNLTVAQGTLTKTEDCPSNVFATLNPLALNNNTSQNYGDFSEGNLKFVGNSATNNANGYSTIGFTKGKWYMETKIVGTQSHYPNLGIVPLRTFQRLNSQSGQVGSDSDSFAYKADGNKENNGSSSYGDSFTTNDIIGIAVDLDNGAIYFSKNGTWQNSGDPTSGASKTGAAFGFTVLDEEYFFGFAVYQSSSGIECNFGNGYFGTTAVSSAGTNASGIGIFEYDVPTGYTALSTKGLNE